MDNQQQKVLCPFCNNAINARDVYQNDNYAFCQICKDGFRIADKWQESFNRNNAALSSDPPEGFQIVEATRGFTLIYKKPSLIGIVLIVFSLPFILMPVSLLIFPQVSEGFSIGKTLLALPFMLCGLLALWVGFVKLLGTHKIMVKPSGEGIFATEVGPIKTTQRFYWNDIKSVRVSWSRFTAANSSTAQMTPEVVLLGREKFRLPAYFSREECQYIAMFLSEKLKGSF
jgi:hypothetical protein